MPKAKRPIQVIGRDRSRCSRPWWRTGIGDDEVEGLEAAVGVLEVRAGEGVVLPDLRRRAVVEDHVHPGQRGGGVVHLLPVEREVEAGAALGLVVGLEQQRAGAAGGIVDGLAGALGAADADDLGHDARDLRRRVELPLALARLGGEVAHQVFVGVAEQVVALGAVAAEVESRVVEDGDEVGEAVHHLLALAELVGVVEVGDVDHALEVVGLGELGDDLVDLVADLLVALQRDHVGEAAALRARRAGSPSGWPPCRRRTSRTAGRGRSPCTARRPCRRAVRRSFSRGRCRVRIS